MAHHGLNDVLQMHLEEMASEGRLKGRERAICAVIPAQGGNGPRYRIEGDGDRNYLRMNANAYLGMTMRSEVIAAEAQAAEAFGTGPGAVRFISGTWSAHVELERRLAQFHGRGSAMLFSSAYAAVMGTLVPLISAETAVISDALNHNSIINGIALARPAQKLVYRHLDMGDLERALQAAAAARCRRALIVTDGIFSMRGDHAPLARIMELARSFDPRFAENVLVMVDDSHGIGACGERGRGTEEISKSPPADLLVATLGKALGVNGGYVVADEIIVRYLRETSPFYIYSNPITPAEAAAARCALDLLDGPLGSAMLSHLRAMSARFRAGLHALGFETLAGEHPIVPVLLRDSARTAALVDHLHAQGILATGLRFPVVPRGDDEIRFQINADHTQSDIDSVLAALADFVA